MNHHKSIIITVTGAIIIFGILIFNQNFNKRLAEPTPTPETSIAEETPAPRIAKVYSDNINTGDEITLPFMLTGKAVGNWFFEASFPVYIEDPNGDKIAEGIMQAQDEWMTTDHVSFKGEVKKLSNYTGEATLVFKKDNPSGEAQFDEEVRMAIIVK